MDTSILKKIGLTDNEVKIYLDLLKAGGSAYEISKRTGIYRVHVYDKLEQLMEKGLVTFVYKGAKKYFQATHPSKLKQFIEDKKRILEMHEEEVSVILPELEAMKMLPKEETYVEVFKGKEGLKYFLKDIIKSKQEVLITGINDKKYKEAMPIFMKQYFRDLIRYNIKERVITVKDADFLFSNVCTNYRFLEEKQFNPTNTFVYGDKIVIVTWDPIMAVMIKNNEIAITYRNHFEHLWGIAVSRKEA